MKKFVEGLENIEELESVELSTAESTALKIKTKLSAKFVNQELFNHAASWIDGLVQKGAARKKEDILCFAVPEQGILKRHSESLRQLREMVEGNKLSACQKAVWVLVTGHLSNAAHHILTTPEVHSGCMCTPAGGAHKKQCARQLVQNPPPDPPSRVQLRLFISGWCVLIL